MTTGKSTEWNGVQRIEFSSKVRLPMRAWWAISSMFRPTVKNHWWSHWITSPVSNSLCSPWFVQHWKSRADLCLWNMRISPCRTFCPIWTRTHRSLLHLRKLNHNDPNDPLVNVWRISSLLVFPWRSSSVFSLVFCTFWRRWPVISPLSSRLAHVCIRWVRKTWSSTRVRRNASLPATIETDISLDNPQLLPQRSVAIDGVINTGLSFYTRRLIDRKLGMFSFLAKPLLTLLASILTNRVVKFFDQIDRLRGRFDGRGPTPSAPPGPPPPYYQEKADHSKYN